MAVKRQSETILGYLDSALAVEDSVTVQGPMIGAILDGRLGPRVEVLIADGTVDEAGRPSYRAVLFALRDELAASREELSAVEFHHIDLKSQITEHSIERERLHEELAADYTFLRGSLERRPEGRKISARAGLQGPTAQKSSRLVRQVSVAVYKLSKPDVTIPEDRLAAFGFDLDGTVAKLKAKAERFAKLLRQLRHLKRELQMSQDTKDETLERHRNTFVPVTRTLEGYYRLAGKDRLADQIRPSEVQRGRRAIELEDAPEEEPVTTDRGIPGSTAGGSEAPESTPAAVAGPAPVPETVAEGGEGGDAPVVTPAGAESSDA